MTVLSEIQARELLGTFELPFNAAIAAQTVDDAVEAAQSLGYPVVIKGDHPDFAHKTEAGLVRLDLKDEGEVRAAAEACLVAMPDGGQLSVQSMVRGDREFIVGFFRDEVFGPCVSIGIGGVFTEALSDAVFRRLPVDESDLISALDDLKNQALMDSLRGQPAVDRSALARLALSVAQGAAAHPDITEIDINPVLIVAGQPVAVDALIITKGESL